MALKGAEGSATSVPCVIWPVVIRLRRYLGVVTHMPSRAVFMCFSIHKVEDTKGCKLPSVVAFYIVRNSGRGSDMRWTYDNTGTYSS